MRQDGVMAPEPYVLPTEHRSANWAVTPGVFTCSEEVEECNKDEVGQVGVRWLCEGEGSVDSGDRKRQLWAWGWVLMSPRSIKPGER